MFDNFFKVNIAPEVISSLICMGIVAIFAIIIYFLSLKADPLKKPKGLLFIAETGVKFFDKLVEDLMGYRFKGYGGFIMAVACYLFIAFIFGLTGLPSPVTNLAVPLTIALVTFVLIHATSAKYTKWGYFKRYVDPFPIMLPINLITVWAPLLSMALRLFGNAISGYTLMSIVYYFLGKASSAILSFWPSEWNSVFIAPIVTPILHCYFDLFSGFIQTTIFIFLTMINIAIEAPEEPDLIEISEKGGN